jgi:hypothetical protein
MDKSADGLLSREIGGYEEDGWLSNADRWLSREMGY